MIYFLIAFAFIISNAITFGSIGLALHLKKKYDPEFYNTLLYFLTFYFTFGFYSLWGQLIISSFLLTFLSAEVLQKIMDITVLMGLPFIVFASLMFIKLSRELHFHQSDSNNSFGIFHDPG